ncbi:MAG: hypothetical protein OXF26_02715 [Alphaproteobacteria bacterium]|nr:hypothetical protein [Alphaproteobacteria bacterium]MCY4318636.1 hypothetical protein [Alphaproteobacteria bacterium]
MTATFDTLAAARDMEHAGLKREAAEAVASAIRAGQGELITRADIEPLATKTELAALEARLTWRIVGLVIAANALLVAAVKLIP